MLILGGICLIFQVIKAATTGLWWDEALILKPISSMLAGEGWKAMGVLFHEGISTGPALLIPGLLLSWLTHGPVPPLLHLLALSHLLLLFFGWKRWGVTYFEAAVILGIYLIIVTLSPKLYITHFLGEFPGSVWFLLGAWLAFSPIKNRLQLQWAGIFFMLSILSKFIFIMPIATSLFAWLLFQRIHPFTRKFWTFFFKLALGALVPCSFWVLFQWQQYGNLVGMQEGYLRWLNLILHGDNGAGLQQSSQAGGLIKPMRMIFQDVQGLMISGTAPILVLGWLAFQVFSIRQAWKDRKPSASLCIAVGSTSVLAWWVFLSRFGGGGALFRHVSPVIWIGLGAMCRDWFFFRGMSRLNQNHGYPVLGALLSLGLTGVLGFRSYQYVFEHKGLGLYSSWYHQNQIQKWIITNSTTENPVPVLNCTADGHVWYSNVYLPLASLTPPDRYFVLEPCRLPSGSLQSSRFLVGIEAHHLNDFDRGLLTLVDGSWDGQGLYQIK